MLSLSQPNGSPSGPAPAVSSARLPHRFPCRRQPSSPLVKGITLTRGPYQCEFLREVVVRPLHAGTYEPPGSRNSGTWLCTGGVSPRNESVRVEPPELTPYRARAHSVCRRRTIWSAAATGTRCTAGGPSLALSRTWIRGRAVDARLDVTQEGRTPYLFC